MPQIHASSNPTVEPGFLIQLVRDDNVDDVRRWVETADDTAIEEYVRHSDNGAGILHVAASHTCQEMMICLVRRVITCERMLSQDFQQNVMRPTQYDIIALPMIMNYNNKTALQIAVTNDNTNVVRQFMNLVHRWEVDEDFILAKDGNGLTVIQLAAGKRVDTLNSIVEDMCERKAISLLNHKGVHGWTSLHISSINGNSEMVDTIMRYFPVDERPKLIQELDEIGWTALHWAAARGNTQVTESLIDQLPNQTQEEVCGASSSNKAMAWTVFQACACDNTVKTMKLLMKKFDKENLWRILRCPSADGKTVLHLAISEGNAKAVLLILNQAGQELGDELLSTMDSHQMTPADYVKQDSVLAEYLQVSAKVGNNLVLHHAAQSDDRTAIKWLCEHSHQDRYALINTVRNEEGHSALHEACRHDSANAIREMFQGMTSGQISNSIKTVSPSGDNSLHLAAKSQALAALNKLLQKTEKSDCMELLKIANKEGKSVIDITANNPSMSHLITGYTQLCKGAIDQIFDHHFNFSGDEAAIDNAYRHIEPRLPSVPGFVCHANIGAAACIEKGDFVQASYLIQAAAAIDQNNIHTIVNAARLLLKIRKGKASDDTEVKMLALMMLDLQGDKRALVTAKMEHAYWLFEAVRTEESRFRCCELMKECIKTDIPEIEDSSDLENICRTLYMKVLIRWVRNVDIRKHKLDKSRFWMEEVIEEAIDQLIYLSKEELKEFYGREMLVWLAEIQKSKMVKYLQPYLENGLQRFREQTKQSTDIDQCINGAIEYCKLYPNDYKFKSRLGFNCLEVAYNHTNPETRKQWFLKAVDFCSENHSAGNWIFMNASTIAAACTHLWAMHHYEQHKDKIDRSTRLWCYPHTSDWAFQVKKPINDVSADDRAKTAWRLLCTDAYVVTEETEEGKRLLKRVLKEHQDIAERHGYKTHGLKMPRIMHLLGEPTESIMALFATIMKCTGQCDKMFVGQDHWDLHHSSDHAVLAAAMQERGLYKMTMIHPEWTMFDAEADLREAVRLVREHRLNVNVDPAKRALNVVWQIVNDEINLCKEPQSQIRRSASEESESDRSDDWRADARTYSQRRENPPRTTTDRSHGTTNHQRPQNWQHHAYQSGQRQRSANQFRANNRYNTNTHSQHQPARQHNTGIEGNWRDRSSQ